MEIKTCQNLGRTFVTLDKKNQKFKLFKRVNHEGCEMPDGSSFNQNCFLKNLERKEKKEVSVVKKVTELHTDT